MIVADVPTREERRGAQLRENPGQVGEWPDYFDDVVDVICPPAYRRDPRDGYATGLSAAPGARDGAPGRHAARHGKPRRNSANLLPLAASAGPAGRAGRAQRSERARGGTRHHAGAAALTAAAFVGTGVGAGMFGLGTFTPPAAAPPAVTTAVPVAGTVPGSGASGQHHAGYLGRHRKPVPAGLGAHPQTSTAAARTAAAAPPAPPSSAAGGSHHPATSSSAPGAGQRPAPVSPSPSSTPRSSGSTGTSTGTGTGGRHASGGQGVVGGLVGDVTGLLGGLGL